MQRPHDRGRVDAVLQVGCHLGERWADLDLADYLFLLLLWARHGASSLFVGHQLGERFVCSGNALVLLGFTADVNNGLVGLGGSDGQGSVDHDAWQVLQLFQAGLQALVVRVVVVVPGDLLLRLINGVHWLVLSNRS